MFLVLDMDWRGEDLSNDRNTGAVRYKSPSPFTSSFRFRDDGKNISQKHATRTHHRLEKVYSAAPCESGMYRLGATCQQILNMFLCDASWNACLCGHSTVIDGSWVLPPRSPRGLPAVQCIFRCCHSSIIRHLRSFFQTAPSVTCRTEAEMSRTHRSPFSGRSWRVQVSHACLVVGFFRHRRP